MSQMLNLCNFEKRCFFELAILNLFFYSGAHISWHELVLAGNQSNHQKGLFNLTPACIVDGDFWVPNEIDSLNFQHMLLFWLREASQNLSLSRQLFFHSFQGGTKGKMLFCYGIQLMYNNHVALNFPKSLCDFSFQSCPGKQNKKCEYNFWSEV